jgi:hypothetical protein
MIPETGTDNNVSLLDIDTLSLLLDDDGVQAVAMSLMTREN